MNLQLTAEQKMIQDMVRNFAANELEPFAQEADGNGRYPTQNLEKMAEIGLLGMTIPADYDGTEMDSVSLSIVLEEISKACASTGSVLIAHSALASYPIVRYGNEHQKTKYLPRLATGESLGACALADSGPSADFKNTECGAILDGEDYVLNGRKDFVLNGENASVYLILAKHSDELLCFIMERRSGLAVQKTDYLVGMRAAGTCELTLSKCKALRSELIDQDGQILAEDALNLCRLLIGAQAVGIGQACLENAVKYSKERHQFGRPISEFEMIQGMLAEMATRLSAARALVNRAAFERDSGRNFSKEAAMAKWYASQTASFAARRTVQIYGGYGYTKDFPVERYMRDAKVTEVYGDTPAIHKLAVARNLLE